MKTLKMNYLKKSVKFGLILLRIIHRMSRNKSNNTIVLVLSAYHMSRPVSIVYAKIKPQITSARRFAARGCL